MRLVGLPVGLIANQRGLIKGAGREPRFGGIVYTESAREGGVLHRHVRSAGDSVAVRPGCLGVHGRPRAGARRGHSRRRTVRRGDGDARPCRKIVLTVNHASGAGYYAMAGQGFDPDFIFSWPTARIGVMEGDSAVKAVHGPDIAAHAGGRLRAPKELEERIDQTRADYDHQLDARYAAARGLVDAVIVSGRHAGQCWRSRSALALLHGPHSGPCLPCSRLCMSIASCAQRAGLLGRLARSAASAQVKVATVDYLMLDYLAEVTMSILQKQKERDRQWDTRVTFRRHGAVLRRVTKRGVQGDRQRRRRESGRVCETP